VFDNITHPCNSYNHDLARTKSHHVLAPRRQYRGMILLLPREVD